MIIYRPHRGNLTEALSEQREFNDEHEMKEYIVWEWNNYFSIEDIVIDDEAVNDERIGWKDTRYVCIKRLNNEDYISLYGTPQCIGMCATNYIK